MKYEICIQIKFRPNPPPQKEKKNWIDALELNYLQVN